MSILSEQDIIQKYWFFEPDPTLRNNLIAFGFECGDGWLPLINELCEKIEKLIDEKYPEEKEYFRVLQVKEKYAGLRFYISSAPGEIHELIDEYENKSYHICENCRSEEAKERELYRWYYTRCDNCWNTIVEEDVKNRAEWDKIRKEK